MKKIIGLTLALSFLVLFSGCNKQIIDTTYSFEKAIIELPGGEVLKGTVDSWTDYEEGDQIQVKIDGKTYLVHASDIILIHE